MFYSLKYKCAIYDGVCENGALADLEDRRQRNHCGYCNDGYFLTSMQPFQETT